MTNPEEVAGEKLADWNAHYNTADGKQKVADRQRVYLLDGPSEQDKAPDYDLEIIEGLKTAGVPLDGSIGDLGCSYPEFLQKAQKAGFSGELAGIEPNTAQFNGLAYWQLRDGSLLLQGEAAVELEGIKLYEAEAGYLPFPDGKFDALTTIFSGYHAFKNRAALYEAKRVIKPDGTHADATSGNTNKEEMIEDELFIAEFLSGIVGQQIIPHEPLQAGFTSEDTIEVFPTVYKSVYVKWINYEVWLESDIDVVLQAFRTYRDSYRPISGELATEFRDLSFGRRSVIHPKIFEIALHEVVGTKLKKALAAGEHVPVKVRRTITFAGDHDLEPLEDKGYEKVSN